MRADKLLFSESSGFVLEAKSGNEARLEELLKNYQPGADADRPGNKKRSDENVKIGKNVADLDLDEARKTWTDRPCGGDEMKIAVMQFPGTNCEFESLVAVKDGRHGGRAFPLEPACSESCRALMDS